MGSWRCSNPVHPAPCWHGKCPICRKGVTAFDYNREDAEAIVASHIAKAHPGAALEGKPYKEENGAD